MTLEIVLSAYESTSFDIYLDQKLSHSEYADDLVILSKYLSSLQVFRDRLNDCHLGMRFAPSKWEILLPDWIGSNPHLFFQGKNSVKETDLVA